MELYKLSQLKSIDSIYLQKLMDFPKKSDKYKCKQEEKHFLQIIILLFFCKSRKNSQYQNKNGNKQIK